MTKLCISTLFVATLLAFALERSSVDAQTVTGTSPSVTNKSATMSLSIAVPIEQIPLGQKPWVSLTVKNLNPVNNVSPVKSAFIEGTIAYPEDRVFVDGPNGEPPTTMRERQLTGRLKPGDTPLTSGGGVPMIVPGDSFTRKYDLSALYDFKEPGKYTVYIEVLDQVSPEARNGHAFWVRSPIAVFEVQAPNR